MVETNGHRVLSKENLIPVSAAVVVAVAAIQIAVMLTSMRNDIDNIKNGNTEWQKDVVSRLPDPCTSWDLPDMRKWSNKFDRDNKRQLEVPLPLGDCDID